MWKIILVVSLLPLIVGLLARRVLYHRVMLDLEEKGIEGSVDARLLAERLCGEKPKGRLLKRWAEDRSMERSGEAAVWAGMRIYAKEDGQAAQAVRVREEAVKFGMVGPIFTFVIMVFAVVVGKLAMGWVLSILVGVLGLSVVFLMLTQSVELVAAKRALAALKERSPGGTREEREALARAIKATGWARLLPKCLGRI